MFPLNILSQENNASNTSNGYKKRVLENTEINLLTSYYGQDGSNAAVTGGIGTEKLNDFATTINVSVPINDDDVLNIDATVSAYTSASSSNLNPFTGASQSGASETFDDDNEDDDKQTLKKVSNKDITGSPWVESTGASRSDVWLNGTVGYSHSSDDRNRIFNTHLSFATEYDYTSFGWGIGYNQLFNEKNTEIGIKANVFFDHWKPQYPTEIIENVRNNGNLNSGYFKDVAILDMHGNPIDKNGDYRWRIQNNTLISDKSRNSFSISLLISQILSKRMQIALFGDVVLQKGWLANPMQRVYFSDVDNFYIGNASSIPFYTSPSNKDVFQLADDIERLPDNRLKFPVGMRLNYYINEFMVLRSYYRFYFDDWGIVSHTMNIELPIKINEKFTVYPSFRYYTQTAADYFAPYEQHISTENYYTSDYDLSKFNSLQYGFGIQYNDIFTKFKINKIGLKTLGLNYSHYKRNTGLQSNIVSLNFKFILGN